MDSLNEIIEERKLNRIKHHPNLAKAEAMAAPQSLRIQNSIDEEAVLIEKINFINQEM